MSPPSKELMKLTLEKKIACGGNQVLRWMMDNIYVKTDVKDEFAQLNEKKAKSGVYDFLVLVVIICALISIFKEVWSVNLKLIMPFLGGGIIQIQMEKYILMRNAFS